MRMDWVPLSASALVIGAMSLVFGSLLNPANSDSSAAQTLHVVEDSGARWLAMSVMYFLASLFLTLGLPAMLTLFQKGGRKLGILGVGLFALGAIGTCGYAMLLVFFRALVLKGAVEGSSLEQVTDDAGLSIFLYGWVGGFYVGLLVIAVALFLANTTARWVPALLLLFVVMLSFASEFGRVVSALQVMALAVAFTGVAMAAVSGEHQQRSVMEQPAF